VSSSSFERVRFVLVAPSHPGNIGAAARAVKTMGFRRLVVVAPRHRDFREQPDAIALATGAADVLAASASCDSLVEALAGVTTAYAMTGYDRQFGPILVDLRSAARAAAGQLGAGGNAEVAFVFGTERAGLANEDIERCQVCCAIPADPTFSSLEPRAVGRSPPMSASLRSGHRCTPAGRFAADGCRRRRCPEGF
jgi:tRNA/rRNA methyltransferase